jgi:hypothetical protein
MKNLQQHFYLIILFHSLFTGCGSYSSDEDKVAGSFHTVVSSMSPNDGEASVSTNTSVSVTFSKEMNSSTVTTNSSDTSCSGTFQVSSDSFSTCIQMSSSPTASNSNKTFLITPSSRLTYGTIYKVILTNNINDKSGEVLSSQYTTPSGFTAINITVVSSSPSDSQTSVAINTSISVTLNEPVDSSTVTTNTNDTSCSGTYQVSSDNFTTCIQMSSSPTVSNSYKSFTIKPKSDLSKNLVYQIRLTTGVKDSSDNALSSQYDTSSGFRTSSPSETYQLGTSLDDYGKAVVVDSSNNIYVVGRTSGELDGNSNSGDTDIFLVKYSYSGSKLWITQWGTSSPDYGTGVAVDSLGNIYVVGNIDDTDNNTNSILLKYNTSGIKQWTVYFESPIGGLADVAVDSSDNIYVIGGNTILESYYEDNYGNRLQLYLAKYNSSGTKQFSVLSFEGGHVNSGYGIAVDSSDNIFVTGSTRTKDRNLNYNSGYFIRKFDSSGNRTWGQNSGVEGYGRDVFVDSSDNVYMTGYVDWDDDYEPYKTLYKWSPTGTNQWSSTTFDWSIGEHSGTGVVTDSSGNIYVVSNNSNNIYLVMYNSSGNKQWTRQYGTTENDQVDGFAIDFLGNIYMTGSTYGGLNGNTNSGKSDIFILKLGIDDL